MASTSKIYKEDPFPFPRSLRSGIMSQKWKPELDPDFERYRKEFNLEPHAILMCDIAKVKKVFRRKEDSSLELPIFSPAVVLEPGKTYQISTISKTLNDEEQRLRNRCSETLERITNKQHVKKSSRKKSSKIRHEKSKLKERGKSVNTLCIAESNQEKSEGRENDIINLESNMGELGFEKIEILLVDPNLTEISAGEAETSRLDTMMEITEENDDFQLDSNKVAIVEEKDDFQLDSNKVEIAEEKDVIQLDSNKVEIVAEKDVIELDLSQLDSNKVAIVEEIDVIELDSSQLDSNKVAIVEEIDVIELDSSQLDSNNVEIVEEKDVSQMDSRMIELNRSSYERSIIQFDSNRIKLNRFNVDTDEDLLYDSNVIQPNQLNVEEVLLLDSKMTKVSLEEGEILCQKSLNASNETIKSKKHFEAFPPMTSVPPAPFVPPLPPVPFVPPLPPLSFVPPVPTLPFVLPVPPLPSVPLLPPKSQKPDEIPLKPLRIPKQFPKISKRGTKDDIQPSIDSDIVQEVINLLSKENVVDIPNMTDDMSLISYVGNKMAWWFLKCELNPPLIEIIHPELHDLSKEDSNDDFIDDDNEDLVGAISDPEEKTKLPDDPNRFCDPDVADEFCGRCGLDHCLIRNTGNWAGEADEKTTFVRCWKLRPKDNYSRASLQVRCRICDIKIFGSRDLAQHVRNPDHKTNFRQKSLDLISCEESSVEPILEKKFSARIINYALVEALEYVPPRNAISSTPIQEDLFDDNVNKFDIIHDKRLTTLQATLQINRLWTIDLQRKWDQAMEREKRCIESYNYRRNAYLSNPKIHASYDEEWKIFWNSQWEKLECDGKDPENYNYEAHWIKLWPTIFQPPMQEEALHTILQMRKSLGMDYVTLENLANMVSKSLSAHSDRDQDDSRSDSSISLHDPRDRSRQKHHSRRDRRRSRSPQYYKNKRNRFNSFQGRGRNRFRERKEKRDQCKNHGYYGKSKGSKGIPSKDFHQERRRDDCQPSRKPSVEDCQKKPATETSVSQVQSVHNHDPRLALKSAPSSSKTIPVVDRQQIPSSSVPQEYFHSHDPRLAKKSPKTSEDVGLEKQLPVAASSKPDKTSYVETLSSKNTRPTDSSCSVNSFTKEPEIPLIDITTDTSNNPTCVDIAFSSDNSDFDIDGSKVTTFMFNPGSKNDNAEVQRKDKKPKRPSSSPQSSDTKRHSGDATSGFYKGVSWGKRGTGWTGAYRKQILENREQISPSDANGNGHVSEGSQNSNNSIAGPAPTHNNGDYDHRPWTNQRLVLTDSSAPSFAGYERPNYNYNSWNNRPFNPGYPYWDNEPNRSYSSWAPNHENPWNTDNTQYYGYPPYNNQTSESYEEDNYYYEDSFRYTNNQ